MQDKYPLEYMDLLASKMLNPNNESLDEITNEQLKTIKGYLENEAYHIRMDVTNQIFATNKKKEIEILVRRYYSSTIHIIDMLVGNRNKLPKSNDEFKQLYDGMLAILNDLLLFIENRFAKFLSLEEKVTSTYLTMTKSRLRQRLGKIQERLDIKSLINDSPFELIISRLARFIERAGDDYEVTLRSLFYKKELLEGLEEIDFSDQEVRKDSVFSKIDRLLIYLNYNSKTYIDELTLRIFINVSKLKTGYQRLERLHYHRKEFKQLHRKPGFILNPKYHDLDVIVETWFEEEIGYWDRNVELNNECGKGGELTESKLLAVKGEMSKVLVNLSADQISLILRGADEARIFTARSMNQVFKSIIPHLSTPNRSNLSYDAMRGKSYVAEERDKEIAIEALEKIIKKIRDY